MTSRVAFAALILLMLPPQSRAGDTVDIEGARYTNVEVVGLVPDGIQYKTEDGNLIVAPWSGLSESQKSMIRGQMMEELQNVKLGAIWLNGDVYQRRKEGIVVRIDIPDNGETLPDYVKGAAVAKGLALLTDHPTETDFGEGDPVQLAAYVTGEYEFDMGIAQKMVVKCSYNPPEWAAERSWTNAAGQVMVAKLVAVKDGKGLFRRDGQDFVVALDQLSEEDQALAKEFVEKIKDIPVY